MTTNTTIKNAIAFLGLAGLAAGCGTTTGSGPIPLPSGYADGVKTVSTPGLTFAGTSKSMSFSIDPVTGAPVSVTGVPDYSFSYRNTSDPNVIIATVGGIEFTLTWDGTTSSYSSADGSVKVTLVQNGGSADGQVLLGSYRVEFPSANTIYSGYGVIGLATDPAQIAALSGTATYNGTAEVVIVHGTNLASASTGVGQGTATLSADFGAGTISGSMTVSDVGAVPGYAIAPNTVITIDPAAISGNGFNGTWSVANPAGLALSSVGATGLQGVFYGVNGADVGGSFNGIGVSADGVTPAHIAGGFMGQ